MGRTGSVTRRILTLVLVVATSISALVAALGVWADTNVFDSERFAVTGSEILAQPEVVTVVTERLTDQVFDLASRMTGRDLDGRAASFLRSTVHTDLTRRLTEADSVRVTQPILLASHRAVLRSINGEQQVVSVNLLPLTTIVLSDLRQLNVLPSWVRFPSFAMDGDPAKQVLELSDALRIEIPGDFGQITLIAADPSPAVATARDLLRVFHDVVLGAIIAAVVLAVAAVVVAPRRPRVLIQLGLGAATAWMAGTVAIDLFRYFILDMVTSTERDAVSVALRLFLSTWTDLSVRLVLVSVALAAIGILLDIMGGLRWIPVLVGVAVAATMRMTPLGLGVGLLVALVGTVVVVAATRGSGGDRDGERGAGPTTRTA